jgi:hypothetical protein
MKFTYHYCVVVAVFAIPEISWRLWSFQIKPSFISATFFGLLYFMVKVAVELQRLSSDNYKEEIL